MFVCSDAKDDFKADVVSTVRKEFKDDPSTLRRFKYYSGDDGDRNDFKNTHRWKHVPHFVFTSPTTTYGIDLNYEAKVFGFYYCRTLNALTVCQQLARIRKPVEISRWFNTQRIHRTLPASVDELAKLDKPEQLKDMFKNVRNYMEVDFDLVKAYVEYYYASEFTHLNLRKVRPHVLSILEKKGHFVDLQRSKLGKQRVTPNKEKKDNIRKEDLLEFVRIVDPSMADADQRKVENWARRYEVIKGAHLSEKLEMRDGKLVLNATAKADLENEFFRRLLVEDKLMQEYLGYRYANMPMWRLEKMRSESLDCEFQEKYKVHHKVLLIKRLRQKVGLPKEFFDFDLTNVQMGTSYELTDVDTDVTSVSVFKDSFRGLPVDKLELVGDCVKHIVKLSKTIFRQSWGKKRMDFRNLSTGGRRYRFYLPDSELLPASKRCWGATQRRGNC